MQLLRLPELRFNNLQKKWRAAALACLMLPSLAFAQSAASLPDPTRPPAGFVDQLSGATSARSTVPLANTPGTPDESQANVLQSVLIPKHGKPVAIIGGKYVPLGERYGDFELVAVTESEVVLARGKERKVLKLTPRAEKKFAQATDGKEQKTQRRPTRSGSPKKESETRP